MNDATQAPEARLGEVPFVVIDLETTGVLPTAHDRIVEIAMVSLDATASPMGEYATLINPERDIGSTSIHGIAAADVLQAPRFRDVLPEVARRLQGAVVVAHNARFDLGFLNAEFAKAGHELPVIPTLCTMDLAYRVRSGTPSRKLVDCCAEAGIPHESVHDALLDAKAAAALFREYLRAALGRGLQSLEAMGCQRSGMSPIPNADQPVAAKPLPRDRGKLVARRARTYLARLVEGLAGNDASDSRTAGYLALLDRAYEDHRISASEAEALIAESRRWGLSRDEVLAVHRRFLRGLAQVALKDGVVSEAERTELEAASETLGLSVAALEAMLLAPPDATPQLPAARAHELRGQSVCFTGECESRINGERISRERAEQLATAAGLVVKQGVSKKLHILVCADPDTQSTKGRRAREVGTRIMADSAFWRAIGVEVA